NHPGGGTEQKCWRHEAQTNRSAGRGPDIARDASSEMDTAHCEYLTTRLGILSCGINGIFGMAGLVLQSSTPSRSSMAVGGKTMVRYGRPAGNRGGAFTKDRGKGGSGPRRRRPAIRHVERVIAPQRGCGRPETPNRLTPGGAWRNSIPVGCTRCLQARTRDTSGGGPICKVHWSRDLSKPDGPQTISPK